MHHTDGVEVTTGPLGQGVANGVGMGLAERWLRNRFSPEVVDHHTFVVCGDGCLEEGISHEAASLAGHLQLGRLVYVYDDNHVTIDGVTELALDDDPVKRFEAYGWDVDDVGEIADDLDGLEAAVRRAMAVEDRPSLIVLRSHIAAPSPDQTDDPATHGYALKDAEISATKAVMGIPDEPFWIPDDVLAYYREVGARGRPRRLAWEQRRAAWNGDVAAFDAAEQATGVAGWEAALPTFAVGDQIATRVASGTCLSALADVVPGLLPGSADLTGNTGTAMKGSTIQAAATPAGRQIHYGIREHAMGAIMTGMARHGGTLPVGGTFLVFSDYMRGAVRLAALSQAKVIYSWTHDSVGVGEDGPTHQPIEQVASLRAIPGLVVIRPADANETVEAWRFAVGHEGPTALILSRQNLPVLEGTAGPRPPEPGRLRAARPARGCRPGRDRGGHRQRGVDLGGGGRAAGGPRRARPGGLAPLLGALRPAGRGLPRRRAPRRRPDAVGRGGHHLRVGSLRGRVPRDRPLRRQRPRRGGAGRVRLHRRERGRARRRAGLRPGVIGAPWRSPPTGGHGEQNPSIRCTLSAPFRLSERHGS